MVVLTLEAFLKTSSVPPTAPGAEIPRENIPVFTELLGAQQLNRETVSARGMSPVFSMISSKRKSNK
ncbi:hypothetical protein CapIbe_011281 [Capra ibex]